jgi:hypothetical protein
MPGFTSVIPQESCVACGMTLRLTEMEPVPTRPENPAAVTRPAASSGFTSRRGSARGEHRRPAAAARFSCGGRSGNAALNAEGTASECRARTSPDGYSALAGDGTVPSRAR